LTTFPAGMSSAPPIFGKKGPKKFAAFFFPPLIANLRAYGRKADFFPSSLEPSLNQNRGQSFKAFALTSFAHTLPY